MAEQQRILSLVPVGLREAMIDSPPFRASVHHFEDQVDSLERWLEGYLKIISDWLNGLHRLEEQTNIVCARAAPGFLAEGLIDPDYTFLAMTRFSEGLKKFWTKIFGRSKEIREVMIIPMTKFLREDVKELKNQKQEFLRIQERYEDLLSRYASQSKSKEPSSIRDEAYQLYSARMSYIQAAASYSIAISTFRTSCDRLFVSAFAGFANRSYRLQFEFTKESGGVGGQIKKLLAWSDEMTASAKQLHDQLLATKATLEKEVSEMMQPKGDLSIYKTYTLSTYGKNGIFGPGRLNVASRDPSRKRSYSLSSSGKPAKQGWLFYRITTGKPARNTWIHRWFFVKDGTFGYLVNSAKTAAVEESERVGVLLCNVKPVPSEDRRFCFEVITKSTSYMLQAESEGELAEWVQVFELAKNAILADEKAQHPQAFAITGPSHAEFAIPPDEHDRHGLSGLATLSAPQPVSPRVSVDVASPASGGGAMHAPRSIVQKLESRLKDRPKASANQIGGIASLVAASQSAIAGHVPIQRLPISTPRPVDIFSDPIGGSNIAPGTLAPPPLSTQMSTRALQARSRSASSVTTNAPNGVMANYWGSMNWGMVAVDEAKQPATQTVDSTNQAQSSVDTFFEKAQRSPAISATSPMANSVENGSRRGSIGYRLPNSKSASNLEEPPIQYPYDYPIELRKQDAQFRTLFPAARPDEFVLLVCRVMWQPIEGRQLWGRMYTTNSGLNFFAHAQGMVCVQSVPFSDITRISHHVGISADNIVIERDNMNPIDAKVYLDSANLVTRRIDVLFRNSLSDQPMDTQEVLQQIRQMEEECDTDDDDKNVKSTTYEDEDFEVSRAPKATEGVYGDEAALHALPSQLLRRSGDSVRVVFPSEPVLCDCKDHLQKQFAEYILQIPAKSLFHLMFGDNTPIWKQIYRARKIEDLEIGPWKSVKKRLVREYKYVLNYMDAISRKMREINLTECHTTLRRDEFLCYVVLIKYRPWDLPRHGSIALLHKYCITYETKTKCKLVISTGVDLTDVPRVIRAFVKRAANQNLEDIIRRVVYEVGNQVNVLGRGSDIQRAIRMYGRIGGVLDTQLTKTGFVGDPAQPAMQRSMASLFMEDMLGTTERMLEDVFLLPPDPIQRTFSFINTHRTLLVLLVVSMFVNLFLSGRSTMGYWHHRRAEQFMQQAGVTANNAMVRMLSLKEVDELVASGLTGANVTTSGLCYKKFSEIYSLNDLADPNYDNAPEFLVPRVRKKAAQLRSSRQQLNVIRHELLVSLRSVNVVEKELVEGEWMTWLGEELYRCNRAAQMLSFIPSEDLEENVNKVTKLRNYCGDCNDVWEKVKETFTSLS